MLSDGSRLKIYYLQIQHNKAKTVLTSLMYNPTIFFQILVSMGNVRKDTLFNVNRWKKKYYTIQKKT